MNFSKIILPAIILAVLATTGWLIMSNPPESNRGGQRGAPKTLVETTRLTTQPFEIEINSYGTVAPRTQSSLVAQVSGQIVEVDPDFRAGGFFEAGDVLLTIDPRDYEADVQIAEASLMDALQAQAQEEARAQQARLDWEALGDGQPASPLVLREPQVQAAKARVASSRSALTKAKLGLERTRVRAPFNGRILGINADLGQVVNPGAAVAEIYATDYVEIRLPVRNADLRYIDLPETPDDLKPAVTLTSQLGDAVEWNGRIVRTEGAIDAASRQLHVIAQIDDPFRATPRPMKIGEYVTAQIAGFTQQQALVIPSGTVYQNSYVYVVEEGVLQRREIDLAWQGREQVVVSAGLRAGDELVTTPLGQVTSGTPVRIANPTNGTATASAPAPNPTKRVTPTAGGR